MLAVRLATGLLIFAGCVVGWGAEPMAARVPLYEGLGNFGRKVTTRSHEAQRYFDQGLTLAFAFNHTEAIRSFRGAAKADPMTESNPTDSQFFGAGMKRMG